MYQYLVPFMIELPCCCIDVPHFVYSFFSCWVFGLFHLRPTLGNAAVRICVQDFGWTYVFLSLRFILMSGLAGSYGNSV